MINNNPYNIPERPLKQKKVVFQTTPLYPHQINRSQDEEYRHRLTQQKKPTGHFFMESSVTEAARFPLSPQLTFKPQALQMSNVTQWDGFQSSFPSYHFGELNERIAAITQRLEAHDRQLDFHDKKLGILMESCRQDQSSGRKHDPISTNLSQSSFSMELLSQNASKQMERYHSTQEAWDKIREEFISYRSQSERLGENLRAELHEQKDSITQELIINFKESLREKFNEEELKISDCLMEFTRNEKAQLDRTIEELKQEMKQFWHSEVLALSKKDYFTENKYLSDIVTFKEKLEGINSTVEELQSRFRSFREELTDNILATQDHKHWLYQLQQQIVKVEQGSTSNQPLEKGVLRVSREDCPREVLHLRYEEYLTVAGSPQPSIQSSQRTYFIDASGFLLDANHFYLVDSSSNRIRLSEEQIQQLKSQGLLK